MNIRELWNSGRVRRFHTHPSDIHQNLADHQWGVTMIIMELVPNPSMALLKHAMYHDVPEAQLGDIPAPVKWHHAALARAYKDAEDKVSRDDNVCPIPLSDEEHVQLKMADSLELLFKCHHEIQGGNLMALDIVINILNYMVIWEQWAQHIQPFALPTLDLASKIHNVLPATGNGSFSLCYQRVCAWANIHMEAKPSGPTEGMGRWLNTK